MKKREPRNKAIKVTSVIIILFFVITFSLLIFATISRTSSDISLFGYRFYYILTNSMEPDIAQGSFVISKHTPIEDLKVGDVISFVSRDPDIEGMINSHSVYSVETNDDGIMEITTKGTANSVPDEYKVYKEDIKGKVVFTSLRVGKFFAILSNRTVSFCVTVLPIAIILIINLVDLFVIINTPEKNEENNNTKGSL